MSDALFITVGLLAAVITVALGIITTRRRHQKDYHECLAPALSRHGLRFVSARYPGAFKVGPFPICEPRANRHLVVNFGNFVEYRVVSCADETGKSFEVWAQLDFQAYILQRLRWRAGPGAALSEKIKALVEI